MNREKIKECLIHITKQKKLFVIFTLALLLVFIMFLLGTKLTLAYHEKLKTEQTIQDMYSFLQDWEVKNDKLKNYPSRPIAWSEVDTIQTNLMFQIQKRKLDLKSMKDTQKKETDGRIFEVEFSGDFMTTLNFVNYLQNNDVLIAIKGFHTEKRENQLNTRIKYKIYTAGGEGQK